MRRLLVVSPNFPPINAPDHQRIRMALPWFPKFGWEPVVLAARPEEVESSRDETLLKSVPGAVRVVRTGALPIRWTRPFGFGSLALRVLPAFHRAAMRMMNEHPFDLAFFSTTMFATMALGPRWRAVRGLPYVLDFQDPWRGDYYERMNQRPPGGRFKYAVAQAIARALEPAAVQNASHIVSVSPAYPETLRARYPRLAQDACTVLPFGAPEADFELVRAQDVRQRVFDPSDGIRRWVYAGRGGRDMGVALGHLFRSVARLRQRDPEAWKMTRLLFIGTSYAPRGIAEPTIMPVARECGVDDIVEETTDRIPYHQSLRALIDADAVLLIGSDDSMYTASKLYPAILARRPILALFHRESSVVGIMEQCSAGEAITFDSRGGLDRGEDVMDQAVTRLLGQSRATVPETDWDAFAPYTAREMTRRLCAIFDRCVEKR